MLETDKSVIQVGGCKPRWGQADKVGCVQDDHAALWVFHFPHLTEASVQGNNSVSKKNKGARQ